MVRFDHRGIRKALDTAVADLDGVATSLDRKDWGRSERVVKVFGEPFCIDRRAGDDQAQFGASVDKVG